MQLEEYTLGVCGEWVGQETGRGGVRKERRKEGVKK